MKTTTQKLDISELVTCRFDESGKRIYIIWPDGYVWIYEGDSEDRTLEMSQTGELYRFNTKVDRWVKVDGI